MWAKLTYFLLESRPQIGKRKRSGQGYVLAGSIVWGEA